MPIPLYQIDAFASRVFADNPAAACPLDGWPEDGLSPAIAQENNLSETVFFVPEGEAFRIRWFTPVMEVDLGGHATLAAAIVAGWAPVLTPCCFWPSDAPLSFFCKKVLLGCSALTISARRYGELRCAKLQSKMSSTRLFGGPRSVSPRRRT
ncbi:MAG: PhzF family phenazine biosynthesis protein [Pseudomonadota bacterium]